MPFISACLSLCLLFSFFLPTGCLEKILWLTLREKPEIQDRLEEQSVAFFYLNENYSKVLFIILHITETARRCLLKWPEFNNWVVRKIISHNLISSILLFFQLFWGLFAQTLSDSVRLCLLILIESWNIDSPGLRKKEFLDCACWRFCCNQCWDLC